MMTRVARPKLKIQTPSMVPPPISLTVFSSFVIYIICNNLSYANDNAKVTFALTYLCGMALDFFKLALSRLDDTLEWLDNWSALVPILCSQFGPIDPADTEDSIDNLKMQDNQCILKTVTGCLFKQVGTVMFSSTITIPDLPNISRISWVNKANLQL